ncbi:hypothetical protein CDAR_184701 [Caerostris darwini]|uniref:Uncharacterized protein n=1 Tax=Caerostris darwini TaxID=1538125 RepID=A0AAV4VWW3_9ARAC|nr:hypothetical protein CDAR_184701 [Caerostris darwini]
MENNFGGGEVLHHPHLSSPCLVQARFLLSRLALFQVYLGSVGNVMNVEQGATVGHHHKLCPTHPYSFVHNTIDDIHTEKQNGFGRAAGTPSLAYQPSIKVHCSQWKCRTGKGEIRGNHHKESENIFSTVHGWTLEQPLSTERNVLDRYVQDLEDSKGIQIAFHPLLESSNYSIQLADDQWTRSYDVPG